MGISVGRKFRYYGETGLPQLGVLEWHLDLERIKCPQAVSFLN
jgi:hypothetical protein